MIVDYYPDSLHFHRSQNQWTDWFGSSSCRAKNKMKIAAIESRLGVLTKKMRMRREGGNSTILDG
jgi:hypothetical protein